MPGISLDIKIIGIKTLVKTLDLKIY